MLNIESILNHVLSGVTTGDTRFEVIDDEHVLDRKTGVELHVYDDWFKLTHNDEIVATKNDFTNAEQGVVWQIKQTITSAETRRDKETNYKSLLDGRRVELSRLYEQPTPVAETVVAEVGTEEYTG